MDVWTHTCSGANETQHWSTLVLQPVALHLAFEVVASNLQSWQATRQGKDRDFLDNHHDH